MEGILAIDQEAKAISRLLQRRDLNSELLTTQISTFEELEFFFPADLINASFCLSFCSANAFPQFWQKITNTLSVGGRFSGHFFGNRDSWCDRDLINCFTRREIETLFQAYAIELFEEEEHSGKTPLGEDRYWHIFHLVARRTQNFEL